MIARLFCGVKNVVESSMFLPVALAMGLALAMVEPVLAQAPLIPTSPVPIEDYVEEGTTKMGTIVGAVVGAWFVFMLVRKGLRWARSAF